MMQTLKNLSLALHLNQLRSTGLEASLIMQQAHIIVVSLLNINGNNQGVHAFIAQIRDADGNICPNISVAHCGHKIGLNGVDNGRIWFDNVRIPRENFLNSVVDVSLDGQYLSSIKDPDQRFAAFLAPLTSGHVTIASTTTTFPSSSSALLSRLISLTFTNVEDLETLPEDVL